MKHVRRGLAAIASLALTAALCTTPAAAAPPANRTAPQGHGDCVAVAPGSELQRRGAAWTCISSGPADGAPARAAVGTGNPGADLCTDEDPDDEDPDDDTSEGVNSTRKAYCTRYAIDYVLRNKEMTAVKGTATVMVFAAASMASLTNARWSEDIIVEVTEMTGEITGVTLSLSSTCSGQCVAGPPAWGGEHIILRAGGYREGGTLTYTSTVGKGFHSFIRPTYHAIANVYTEIPVKSHVQWTGPEVRCDDEVGHPGCIVTGHLANVTFSRAKYRGSAVAYEWAQKNLLGRFGDADNPLSRRDDPLDPGNKKARALTCDLAPDPFPRGATGVPNDSCEEYPFASSHEGGNPGTQCVDITPRQVNGVWDIENVTVDRDGPRTAPCIRAHVDNADNKAAGLELGRAVQSDRILDSEAYQVIIVP